MEAMTPLFRWSGQYWGFLLDDQVHDRYGRHVGWVERAPERPPFTGSRLDVYDLSGRFLGEVRERHWVLRHALRAEPIHRAPRPAVPCLAPLEPPPSRDAREPRDDWSDALPWPLRPPEPIRL
jgi:hypothetical protein